jgi:DNA polymerase (family 10)
MKNSEIIKVFSDIADLLELKGENQFKIGAYRKAVRSIKYLSVEVEQLFHESRLNAVPGVGEAIAKKITELITTGRLGYYEKLRAEFPEGISNLLDIPSVGPKMAMMFSTKLGIHSVDELEAAIVGGSIAKLHGIGDKTTENILHQIQAMKRKEQRIPIENHELKT